MSGLSREQIQKSLNETRAENLSKALGEAITWFSRAPGGKRGEDYWLKRLGAVPVQDLNENDASAFINEYQLDRRGWDKSRAMTCLNQFLRTAIHDDVLQVVDFAQSLHKCLKRAPSDESALANSDGEADADAQHTMSIPQEISAASKFAMFSKPERRIFIWDKLATTAISQRAWVSKIRRLGEESADPYRGYAVYCQRCEIELRRELGRDDFKAALAGYSTSAADQSQEFLARRLFDKLLFLEGNEILRLRGQRKRPKG
jgi:hypothetical protein